jgi:iron(III) transport system substrate-binding protein
MKKIIFGFIMMICASNAMAQSAGWQKVWDQTLTAAKAEGKVVVGGSPDPIARKELIPKFVARFGIPIEYVATGSGAQMAEKVTTERSAGLYTYDIFLNGAAPTVNVLYTQKMIDPIRPLLILPEVVEGAHWKPGKLTFVDPEQEYILMLFSSISDSIFINADYVKPEEMRSIQDLLNPKWKGKISSEELSGAGTALNKAVNLYSQLGPEFVKKLYIDQQPIFSHERRQLTDWLARGTYPICLTCRDEDMQDLQTDGFNLVEIFNLAGMKKRVTSAPFLLTLANRAPHPNAARIFVNWMATSEAVGIYAQNSDVATLRNDVDESHVNQNVIPQAGVSYVDDTDFDWISKGRLEASDKVRALLNKR